MTSFRREWIPAGMTAFSQLADTPGRWRALWLRMLSLRLNDHRFDAMLTELERWLSSSEPSDWQARLDKHCAYYRNRYFAFLLWSDAGGDALRDDAALPDIQFLQAETQSAFKRWRAALLADFAALATTEAWRTSAVIANSLTYRGVDLAPSFDYYVLPELLKHQLLAFESAAHA